MPPVLLAALAALLALLAAAPAAAAPPRRLPAPLRAVAHPLPPLPDGPPRTRELALLLALAARLDARHHLSRDPAWLAIMGWEPPTDSPLPAAPALDAAPGRYPTRAGRADPAADLRASLARAFTEPDFSCRFPLRARFLAARDLVPGPLALDTGGCPAFDAWAQLDRVDGVELLFATPSWAHPASSFGHLFLRIRHKGDAFVTGQSFEPVYSYAVDLDRPGAAEDAVWRGLTGQVDATVIESQHHEMVLRYAIGEQRDLIVYDLVLTPAERRDFLAQLFAQRHGGMSVPYRFLSVNCARLTWDAVRAVAPELPRQARFLVHPHEVVSDLLEHVRLRLRGMVPSRRTLSRQAERTRDRLAPRLAAVPGFAAAHGSRAAPEPARAAALGALRDALASASLPPPTRAALAEYADAVIDAENEALRAGPDLDEATSTVAMDAALDLRATLPIRPTARVAPLPEPELLPSGSRRAAVRAGVTPAGHPRLALRHAVLDEDTTERRAAGLGAHARHQGLVSETRVRWDGDRPVFEGSRFVFLAHDRFGLQGRPTDAWLARHLGLGFSLGGATLPAAGLLFGLDLRARAHLTLAERDDFRGLLAAGLELRLASYLGPDDWLHAALGPRLELVLPLTGAHRLRLDATLLPTWRPPGPHLQADATLRLDLLLSARLGLFLSPFATFAHGAPDPDASWAGLTLGL